ncbi:hypothetical protein JCM8202_003735 [Rhodotorula sphaerocarpa]
MSAPPPPPPRRTVPASSTGSGSTTPKSSGSGSGGGGWKGKASAWGMKAFDKTMQLSDKIAPYANDLTEKAGGERWWPSTGDFKEEVAKCTRIFRAFTVDGVATELEDKDNKGIKRKRKAFRKIPAEVLRAAKGLCVYTSMRSGIAPLGGAGGSGLIVAKLPDGSWSAPSCVAPGNFSGGLLIGLDIFDAVLVIMTQESLDAFMTHKVSLGGELAVAAGTYGAGALAEVGIEKTPILSYQRSRGFYAGVEALAQVYLTRFDENERVYALTGVTQRDILTGHVRPTPEAQPFLAALREAETGFAQRTLGAENQYEQNFETKTADEGSDPLTQAAEKQAKEHEAMVERAEAKNSVEASGSGVPTPEKRAMPPPPPGAGGASSSPALPAASVTVGTRILPPPPPRAPAAEASEPTPVAEAPVPTTEAEPASLPAPASSTESQTLAPPPPAYEATVDTDASEVPQARSEQFPEHETGERA